MQNRFSKLIMVPPTITNRRIAQEAGLSETTVSLVLNNRAEHMRIKPATRRRVLEIARRHNYVPNPLARGLSGKTTKTIGIIWSLGRPNQEGFVRQIATRVWRRGYVTYMSDGLSDPDICLKVLDDLARRAVDGVIFRADRLLLNDERILERLSAFKAATVVADEHLACPIDLVVLNIAQAVNETVDYLVQTGRRRIGVMGSAGSIPEILNPLTIKAKEYGLPEHDRMIGMGRPDHTLNLYDYFYEGLEQYSQNNVFNFDALMFLSDDGAAAGVKWLRERGLDVPTDVAVIGRGNVDLTRATDPPLASLHLPYEKLSETIEQSLFRRLERPDEPIQVETVPTVFVWRESAGSKQESVRS